MSVTSTDVLALSERMQEILRLAATGSDTTEIAIKTGLKKSSVRTYWSMIRKQFDVSTDQEAVDAWKEMHHFIKDGSLIQKSLTGFVIPTNNDLSAIKDRIFTGLKPYLTYDEVRNSGVRGFPPSDQLTRLPLVGMTVYFYESVKELMDDRRYDGSKHYPRIVQARAAIITEVEEPGNPESRLALCIMTRNYTKHHYWVVFGQTKADHWGWPPFSPIS